MKNTVIFASSTSFSCGSKRLAIHKAGLFCFRAKGVFLPISGGLPLPNAKKRTARASGLVDGGIRQAAFLSAYVNKSHNAHRNYHTTGTHLPGAPNHQGAKRRSRRPYGAGRPADSPRIVEKIPTPTAGNAGVKHYLSTSFSPFIHTHFSISSPPAARGGANRFCDETGKESPYQGETDKGE